jgi:uncharacterized Zn finger protein
MTQGREEARHMAGRKPEEFGSNWWAKKWNIALERFGWSSRLQSGRTYARGGRVLDFSISAGLVKAKVRGTRVKPYKVSIQMEVLKNEEWQKVIAEMSKKAIFSARLLSGEMPENIEEAFKLAGVSLFPDTGMSLVTGCSCPDYANPCKHIAAVYYTIGQEFDRDPFMIFKLRGMGREQMLHMLKKARLKENGIESGSKVHEQHDLHDRHDRIKSETLDEMKEKIKGFDKLNEEIINMEFSFSSPQVALPIIKRLGHLPFFKDREEFKAIMKDYYESAGERVKSML